MYDELIKALRNCANPDKCCEDCGFFDKCYKSTEHFSIEEQAADAIEELQKQLREEKVDNVNLTGWLAEEHAKQCPHYIRNVHDRGDDSLCDKWVCEVKSLPKWIPVTERLPEHSGDYLVYSVGGNWKQLSAVEIGFWDDKRFIVQSLFDATHWMPLPQSPESEET